VSGLAVLGQQVVECTLCPRLVAYRREIAITKRRAYRDWEYWGRPVPGFGDPQAQVLIIGLAPGAHGANRTGRVFTGDRSGDFLYRALYDAGFASQPESRDRNDGLELKNAYITASVRCAPPDNKPSPEEFRRCRPWLEQEIGLLPNVRVVIVLGRLACDGYLLILKNQGLIRSRAEFSFGHGRQYQTGPGQPVLLCSYHPSQQNTSTGRLTARMLLEVMEAAQGRL
jgi:uracil-DNA glycosylase family 4